MCGIAAILLYPQRRSEEDWQAIKDAITRNLICNQEQGQDATGLPVVGLDGQFALLKMPGPASEFVRTPEYQALLNRIDADTTLLLGHARRPTKGTAKDNSNNHPLRVGTVLGVHNGHIENDDELFLQSGHPRLAQVDSEIVFRLLASSNPELALDADLEELDHQLALLSGTCTFLAVNLRMPGNLPLLKQDNPMSAHSCARWNAMIFSSRYAFLRQAWGRALRSDVLPRNRLVLYDAQALPTRGPVPLAARPLLVNTGSVKEG